jgi:hypothetical protein
MPPRPIRRWKSFWFGIVVLAFLGWGWMRSLHHIDGVLWMTKHFEITAGQGPGGLFLNGDGHPFPLSLCQWIHEPAAPGEPWFPTAVNGETYSAMIQLTVSHWFLILLFLIPWTAFLLWRVRRMKRLAAGP